MLSGLKSLEGLEAVKVVKVVKVVKAFQDLIKRTALMSEAYFQDDLVEEKPKIEGSDSFRYC